MADRIEVHYELTREDFLAVNEACLREGAAWSEALARHRRAMRRQALWAAPFCVAGGALLIGRAEDTQGMYAVGGALGAGLAGLMYFALPRLDTVDKQKRAVSRRVERFDWSPYIGTVTVAADDAGVHIRSPDREFQLSWRAVAPSAVADYVLLGHAGNDATIVPFRAFESPDAARAFLAQALRWREAAQVPHAERLATYLADRDDIVCPRCGYNLRGVRIEACPECGSPLRLDELTDPGRRGRSTG
jgi:hypothetical protein